MRKVILSIAIVFYFLAPQANAQEKIEDIRNIIQSQNMIYMQGYKEKNAEKVASVHTKMARVFPPNKTPVIGRSAVIEMINDEVAAGDIKLTLETQSLERQGDAVLEIGKFSVTLVMENGDIINDQGNTVVIWKKNESGQWLMDLDIWNSTLPLMF